MLVVTYAHAGRGKTVDAWAACAGQAVFLGLKKDLRSLGLVYGVNVDKVTKRARDVEELDDLLGLLEKVPPNLPLIVDDLSRMSGNTRLRLEHEYELVNKDGEKVGTDAKMWAVLKSMWGEAIEMLYSRPALTVLTHRQQDYAPAKTGNWAKDEVPEGPDCGWTGLTKSLVHEAALVQRYELSDERWNSRAICDPVEYKAHKDRLTPLGYDRPANLRAILGMPGVEAPELPQWPQAWLNEAPKRIAEELLGGAAEAKVLSKWKDKLSDKPRGLVYMAIRDGRHLAEVSSTGDMLDVMFG